MKKKKIIIGSRRSKLALVYAEKAKEKIIQNTNFRNENITIKEVVTKGDKIFDKRLSDIGGKGLFSSELEKELQEKKIDIAVHALKDMPSQETKGLQTEAFIERNDPREILISKSKIKLRDLKSKSIIGTSSFRREFQIRKIRDDLNYKLIRGNIDTRINKLHNGQYDAIILSYAGVKLLNLNQDISEIFSIDEILPSAGQGIICLQCRNNDKNIISILNEINHKETSYRALAERNVLKVLDGNCETAVGAHAITENNNIILKAELFSLDGSSRYYEKKTSKIEYAAKLGEEVGNILKDKSKNSYKK